MKRVIAHRGGGNAALPRPAASLTAVLAAGLWLATSPGSVGNRLIATLESSFSRTSIGDAEAVTGVIALGGGEERIREAGRLARKHPHLKVLVSGAGEPASVLRLLGDDIDPARVIVEASARNTHENALFSTMAAKPKRGERWLLVTSAAHMPRAIGAFRRNAFMVEPWPVYDLADNDPQQHYAVAQHEWLGLVAYWLLGRTSELFPSAARPASRRQAALTRRIP